MNDLRNKTALITGGTSGIGRATALAAAAAGINVVITGRREPEGLAAIEAIKKHGVKAEFVRGDVTDESHVQDAVARAVRLGGRLDLAFNNAGIELAGFNTADSTAEHYRKVFDVNVLGVLLSMKHQIRAMLASGSPGSIVNNASIAGSIGMPGVGIYIASKHAVLGLTKAAALEVARQNIRINSVSPAAIDTEMFDRFTGNRDPQTVTQFAGMHPIGRVGQPDEIARPVLFLWSSASGFITGHDLKVDGGYTVP